MAYIPPSSNAVNFTVAGSAYTPPASSAVDFTSYVTVAIAGSGFAAYSPSVSAAGGVGVSGSGSVTYYPSVAATGFTLVSGAANASYAPVVSALGEHANNAVGLFAYSPTVAASGTVGPPSYVAIGAASYLPIAHGWETPPTGAGMAQYRPWVAGFGAHGVSGAGLSSYKAVASASGAHGCSAVGLFSYNAVAVGAGRHGVSGQGSASYKPSIAAEASTRKMTTGNGIATYTPDAQGVGIFGHTEPEPDFMVFVRTRERGIHVVY